MPTSAATGTPVRFGTSLASIIPTDAENQAMWERINAEHNALLKIRDLLDRYDQEHGTSTAHDYLMSIRHIVG